MINAGKKQLEINLQDEITSYCHHAIPLCVVLSDEKFYPWLCSHFTQIHGMTTETGYLIMDFTEHWAPYRLFTEQKFLGYLELEGVTDIIQFVKNEIDHDTYVSLYVDEYYLSQKESYMQQHYVHPSLIYGYNDETRTFQAAGYNEDSVFTGITFDYDAFALAYIEGKNHYQESMPWIGNMIMELIKRKEYRKKYPFQYEQFMKNLGEYLQGKSNEEIVYCQRVGTLFLGGKAGYEASAIVYGKDVQLELERHVRELFEGKITFDYRPVHLLFEHKKSLYRTLTYIKENKVLSQGLIKLIERYKEVIDYAQQARFLYLDEAMEQKLVGINDYTFLKKPDDTVIQKILDALEQVRNLEMELLPQIYDKLSMELNIGTSGMQRNVMDILNDTQQEYEEKVTIAELFERQIAKTPETVAVRCGDDSVTYKELNERVNRIANHLRGLGIKRDEIVPVIADRQVNLVAGIIGIIKSGAAYLPLDPEYPDERVAYMLEHSQARAIVVGEGLEDRIPEGIKQVSLAVATDENEKSENPVIVNESCDLAYVIYTSGSTGKPKGVMIEQRHVVNLLKGMEQQTGMNQYKTILSVSTICFDMFVSEFFVSLLNGMTLTLSKNMEDVNSDALAEVIEKDKIEVMVTTPSRFKLLLQGERFRKAFKTLKMIQVGGEALPKDLLSEFRTFQNLRIINMYGPTENAVWASYKEVTDERAELTIGKPLANVKFYVVDENRKLVQPGEKGEICIGGAGVARGYFRREDLTADRFIVLDNGERVYRTGDLGCILMNAEIQYLGRIDFQVKIRGYRVELGEIENALMAVDGIEHAVVTAAGKTAEKELCAYYVSKEEINPREIRDEIGKTLAKYMVPSYFVRLEELPLSPNGKINRKALPAPGEEERVRKEYIAPVTEKEQLVSSCFCEVLQIRKAGLSDDFFDLGGHSLKAVKLINLIEEKYKKKLSFADVKKDATVEGIARLLA